MRDYPKAWSCKHKVATASNFAMFYGKSKGKVVLQKPSLSGAHFCYGGVSELVWVLKPALFSRPNEKEKSAGCLRVSRGQTRFFTDSVNEKD